ncbi:MAG: ABC transporter ATP-binding protein [Peptococcaceae bacterium]|nr:MAG: ABC transporter ATP-binding protein [Peptococcaceae bacterium]
MEYIIEAAGLVKKYNGKTAVDAINFTVRQQECFGLLGPNGAGKTSTVKMIHCFFLPTAGRLSVLGMDVRTHSRAIKRHLGVVPQENNLDPDLSVLENLLVYAGFFGIARSSVLNRAGELLDFFDLSGYERVRVETLSGGMKRRLIIARALINSPQILILDEPTTGLDPQARHLVWQRLRHLKEQGVTILLTTHYMDEAAQWCDRLVIMDKGGILEEGKPQELVLKHVGKEVLEIGLGNEPAGAVLEYVSGVICGHLVIGDTLYLYSAGGQAVLQALQRFPGRFTHQLLRYATLEDVFLKLTGRGLTADGKAVAGYFPAGLEGAPAPPGCLPKDVESKHVP